MVIHGKQIKEFQLLEHINNGEKLQYLTTPQNPGLTLTVKCKCSVFSVVFIVSLYLCMAMCNGYRQQKTQQIITNTPCNGFASKKI